MLTLLNNIRARGFARFGICAGIAAMLLAGCGDGGPGVTPTAESVSGVATAVPGETPGTPQSSGNASNGTLDRSFGSGGKLVTDLDGESDEAHAVVVQKNGKIIAVGQSYVMPQDRPRFAIVRYNADGSVDESYGDDGQVITGMTDDEYDYSVAHAATLDAEGKLLVAGTTYDESAGHNVFALARFNEDGSFDKTFGKGGKVLTTIDTSDESFDEMAFAMAVDQDGKIVLAGSTGAYPSDFAAARFLGNGKLDTTFGNKGKVITDLGGNDKATAIAIQNDGKIVVAGNGAVEDQDWAMLRYTASGKVDTSFGSKGIVSLDFKGGEDHVGGVAVRPDGKILLGGVSYTGVVFCHDYNGGIKSCDNYAFSLAQYTADGKLDKSFGTGGSVVYESEIETGGYALALQPDGKALLAGHLDDDDFAVIRVDASGELDDSFGDGGLVHTPFGNSFDVAYALALQANGDIVLAGTGQLGEETSLNSDFALLRYGR